VERHGQPGTVPTAADLGDVVLRRADGVVAYHLATAVDELLLGITDVVRGADLWPSTAAQVAVMNTLGMAPPRYGHIPLWRQADGQRLSKRTGAEGLEAYRHRGMDADAVVGELAASLALVPRGSRLSAAELLQAIDAATLDRCLDRARLQAEVVQT
jgi:glutamyl-tRNA synthetase